MYHPVSLFCFGVRGIPVKRSRERCFIAVGPYTAVEAFSIASLEGPGCEDRTGAGMRRYRCDWTGIGCAELVGDGCLGLVGRRSGRSIETRLFVITVQYAF